MKRAVIVQCRLSSTRLPNKALYDLGGKPLISWTLRAMKKVPADFYIVATDYDSEKSLKNVCEENGFECFAGPLEDVLERFCMVVRKYNIDTVVRATGDNPFLFYEAAAESADEFDKLRGTENQCAYLTYSGLPHGCGVEIFDGNLLLKAAALTQDPYDHEHAGPAFYRHQENFKCCFKKAPEKYFAPALRTTVDTYGDFLRAVSVLNFYKAYSGKSEITEPLTTEEIRLISEKPEVQKPVILVPSVKCGRGTGHLVRCLKTASETGAFLYVPEYTGNDEAGCDFYHTVRGIVQKSITNGLNPNQVITRLPEKAFNCTYIVDTFSMKKREAEFYSASTLVCIDDGSSYKDKADYVLDIIPSYKNTYKPNFRNIRFLDLPENSGKKPVQSAREVKKVLVCFGGEDPAGLTEPVSKKCREIFTDAEIVSVTRKNPVPDLKNHLAEYDLVFTHYGLTAFETLSAGSGVILLPTTGLHKKLSEKYGFANCNVKGLTESFVSEMISSGKIYNRDFFVQNAPSQEKENISLSDFVKNLSTGKTFSCPVCGKLENEKSGKIISRNETRTYRRCPSCGMVYISFSCVPETKYEKEYFFESYKNQYGKTYKEDFENIKASCVKRVSVMNSILPPEKDFSVLDVGCAYGPFLKAASENGWKAYGTDICDDAVESVKKELGFSACVSAFPEIDTEKEFGIPSFDAITMWYVIEHFQDLKAVLEKVSSLVRKGGLFAFSTPSGEGVSASTDKDHFYSISPTDHYSVWEPSRADRILKSFGFKVVKTVSTGHHPERFPEIKEAGAEPGSELWAKVMKKSQKKNLGDTVEVYCRKIT